MDHQITWSPEALEDAEEIAQHIHKSSPHYAGVVIEKIIETSRALEKMTHRGRVVPELGLDNYREIFIYSYRLIYHVGEDSVLVVAVIHGHRLLMNVIADRIPSNEPKK